MCTYFIFSQSLANGSTMLLTLTFALSSLLTVSADGYCSENCLCSMEKDERLGERSMFNLSCVGEITGLLNASLADIFSFEINQTHPVSLDTNIISTFYNLKALYITGGLDSIASIPATSSLRVLDVRQTELNYLPSRVLSSIAIGLQAISLSYTNIGFISDGAFYNLSKLRGLNLSHNRVEKLGYQLFADCSKVITLDLSHNHLLSVKSADFIGLLSIREVFLNNNRITSLDFIALPNPAQLHIRFNPIVSVQFNGSHGSSLNLLDISYNNIRFLSEVSFSNCDVTTLRITNSPRLRMVDRHAFVNMTIKSLDLHDNPKLAYLDNHALYGLDQLVYLNISFNSLRVIPPSLFQLPSIREIEVRDNPLLCDCNLGTLLAETQTQLTLSMSLGNTSECPDMFHPAECEPHIVFNSESVTVSQEGEPATLLCKVCYFMKLPASSIRCRASN